MISFGDLPPVVLDMPWLLLAAVLLPALVWYWSRKGSRARMERLGRMASAVALSRLVSGSDAAASRHTLRLLLVMVLLGLALAGPRWGYSAGPVSSSGIDMAIAVDVSLSMLARDERPSRLERAKQEIRRLRAQSPADRVALIAFAGRSYILTPLTNDEGAIELFLDNLDPGIVGQGGSALARAIRQGAELLGASDGSADRALVVLSDGEAFDPEEDIRAAASEAGRRGVSVVTVGFGTERGATIPVLDGNRFVEKRDDDGNVVVTHYSPKLLEMAATEAGGTFIEAGLSDKASRIRAALGNLREARRTVNSREDHVPRFIWLLVPALLVLLWDSWRLVRPSNGLSGPRHTSTSVDEKSPVEHVNSRSTAVVALLLALTGLLASCRSEPDPAVLLAEGDAAAALKSYRSQVVNGDTSARTRYNLGTALLGVDSLDAAGAQLDSVATVGKVATDAIGAELTLRARFNAGLAALLFGRRNDAPDASGRLAKAKAFYRALLADRPGYADGKWNYELALRDSPPAGGGGGGGGGSSDQDQSSESQSSLDRRQAEALLNSAAREERDVQGRKLKQRRPPPGGRDW